MYLEIIIAVSGRSLGFVGSSGRYLAFVGSSGVGEVLCTYYVPFMHLCTKVLPV